MAKNPHDFRYVQSDRKIRTAIFSLLKKHSTNIKVKDICKKAKVKNPTFYNHFKNTDQIIESTETIILSQFQDLYTKLQPQNPTLSDIFYQLLIFVYKNRIYFFTASKNQDYSLMFQILSILHPEITKNWLKFDSMANEQIFIMYSSAIISVIYLWCQNTNFNLEKISSYIKLLNKITIIFKTQGTKLVIKQN